MSWRHRFPWQLFAAALLTPGCGAAPSPAADSGTANEARASDTSAPGASPAAGSKESAPAAPTQRSAAAAGTTAAPSSPAAMRGSTPASGSAAINMAMAGAAASGAAGTTLSGAAGTAALAGSAASGTAAQAGSSGSGASTPSTSTGTMTSGPAPKLPEITGECPKFATGDWSFSGLTGVMEAGTKSEGTAPLVFYWAGTDFPASAYTQVGDNNVKRVTSEGGLIVSIQGSAEHALDTDCSITGYYSHDFEPIGQIAACAVRDYGIDPRRIFSTGCSAGGVTSGCLATRASGYIAAVATSSGGLTSVEELSDPSHVPPVMTMHGGAADFGGLFTTDSRNLNMAIKNAGGFAVNCDHGGGHCAASPELQNAAFEFLWAHPFGVDPEPYASALPMSFPSYCKIY